MSIDKRVRLLVQDADTGELIGTIRCRINHVYFEYGELTLHCRLDDPKIVLKSDDDAKGGSLMPR